MQFYSEFSSDLDRGSRPENTDDDWRQTRKMQMIWIELKSRMKTPIQFMFKVRTRKLIRMRLTFTHIQKEENSFLHTS